MIQTREELEKIEAKTLLSYAVKSGKSIGRKYKEKQENERLCFQKDKDRIVHSKSFRRLNEKTQVFIAGSGDHYRTRLTHTLEVAQISQNIARKLGLNEDLCEAIALAHDLGHPPFGHSGEEALNEAVKPYGMHFEHNEQSKRIVEKLEKCYPDFDGLNLTFEVLEGLIKHQTAWDQKGKSFEVSPHLEAQIVNIADEIAYMNHDMDDGLRANLIKLIDLKKFKLWKLGEKRVEKIYGQIKDKNILISRVISGIISTMIEDFCLETEKNIKKLRIIKVKDIKNCKKIIAHFSKEMRKMSDELRKFLYDHFYMNPSIHTFVISGQKMIKKLFNYYMENPKKFPKDFENNESSHAVRVKDYIAGMTDGYLMREFKRLVK